MCWAHPTGRHTISLTDRGQITGACRPSIAFLCFIRDVLPRQACLPSGAGKGFQGRKGQESGSLLAGNAPEGSR